MSEIDFQELASALKVAADTINAFPHESVQIKIVEALIRAYENDHTEDESAILEHGVDGDGNETVTTVPKDINGAPQLGRQTKKRSTKYVPALDKDLNLHPDDAPSLKEFAQECQPKTQNEYCLVSIYWFIEKAHIDPVTADMVYTAFRNLNVSLPADFINMIAKTGSKGWIHSGERTNLKLSTNGINFVEREMTKRSAEVVDE
ncbi:hypothetical protein [Amycolatopsis sp. cmx-11-12]|uniref:hypothetical protein n=1 Tax=Amycolatopsis sp. cmx-11-12 TaxID=2785795 RepID=UPI003917E3B5